ncbi:MAG: hypothetical protein M3431_02580 [Actinomycetota bacterium]|nr:hypothetical protein [Actinomycetota bacterium]
MATWTYPHVDLEESPHPDGSPILRPVVPLMRAPGTARFRGVIDSGSPISAADATLFGQFGIDIDNDPPLFEVGLTVNGQFARAPVFAVTLWLHPPETGEEAVSWQLPLVARRGWRMPFAVLLGQRGWFDRFPTRIDASSSTVEVRAQRSDV